MVKNRSSISQLSSEEVTMNSRLVVKEVERLAAEYGFSEDEAYRYLLSGESEKKALHEMAEGFGDWLIKNKQ